MQYGGFQLSSIDITQMMARAILGDPVVPSKCPGTRKVAPTVTWLRTKLLVSLTGPGRDAVGLAENLDIRV